MRITSLVENTCLSGKYEVEHGLSLYIETENSNIYKRALEIVLCFVYNNVDKIMN